MSIYSSDNHYECRESKHTHTHTKETSGREHRVNPSSHKHTRPIIRHNGRDQKCHRDHQQTRGRQETLNKSFPTTLGAMPTRERHFHINILLVSLIVLSISPLRHKQRTDIIAKMQLGGPLSKIYCKTSKFKMLAVDAKRTMKQASEGTLTLLYIRRENHDNGP